MPALEGTANFIEREFEVGRRRDTEPAVALRRGNGLVLAGGLVRI
jgi:hypothetical protein